MPVAAQDHRQAPLAEPSVLVGGLAQFLAQLSVDWSVQPTPHR